jgi:hypothetical protein
MVINKTTYIHSHSDSISGLVRVGASWSLYRAGESSKTCTLLMVDSYNK